MITLDDLNSGWVNTISCFYSAAAAAVCNAGFWAGWMEQKQERLFTQPDF